MAWTGRPSVSTSWTGRSEWNSPSWFLMKEDGGYLLTEGGWRLILDNGPYISTSWTGRPSVNTSWTPRATVA